MTRPCPWTVVLLACFCSAIDDHAVMTDHEKKLELLSTIIKYDDQWNKLLTEKVFYKLDRTYYGRIIENELLKNERLELSATYEVQGVAGGEVTSGVEETTDGGVTSSEGDKSGSTPPNNDIRDLIIPYNFVRNIILKRRYVVGSILNMGLNVIMLSFKCLLYKHMVHLINLVYVSMKRSKSQKTSTKWSGQSKSLVEEILMKMGALQFTDPHILALVRIFGIYNSDGSDMSDKVRSEYNNQLSQISNDMLNYVNDNCVDRPNNESDKCQEEQVAEMIDVYKVPMLYNTAASFAETPNYKKMVKESWKKFEEVFGGTLQVSNIAKNVWRDILKFFEISEKLKKK